MKLYWFEPSEKFGCGPVNCRIFNATGAVNRVVPRKKKGRVVNCVTVQSITREIVGQYSAGAVCNYRARVK